MARSQAPSLIELHCHSVLRLALIHRVGHDSGKEYRACWKIALEQCNLLTSASSYYMASAGVPETIVQQEATMQGQMVCGKPSLQHNPVCPALFALNAMLYIFNVAIPRH